MKNFIKKTLSFTLLMFSLALSFRVPDANAAGGRFSLSPMNQLIVINPGETFEGNFEITNPADATIDFEYELRIEPFFVNNENDISLTANGDYNQMVDWIVLPKTEGVVAPNTTERINFQIHVPENTAAGGQYASIVVSSKPTSVTDTSNVNLQAVFESGHLIYAEVAGETVRKGNVTDVSVPGLLFSGNITGSAMIVNEGNVHSQAISTLQIFPLFSDEEVFTNEEDPKKSWIMPGNTTLTKISWEETPSIGIFHVIYNVEYEGVNSNVDKIVIVCPLWLLFLILLAIFLIIFKILSAKKTTKKKEA